MIIIPKKNFGINDSIMMLHFSLELQTQVKTHLPGTSSFLWNPPVPTVIDVYLALESERSPYYAFTR